MLFTFYFIDIITRLNRITFENTCKVNIIKHEAQYDRPIRFSEITHFRLLRQQRSDVKYLIGIRTVIKLLTICFNVSLDANRTIKRTLRTI